MVKKAFEEKGSAAASGHNKSDKRRMEIQEKFLALEAQKQKIGQQQKDLLAAAKDEGFLKTPFRKAAKILTSSPEQFQAQTEVERETKYTIQLFASKGGQYSWLSDINAGEEAA